MLRNCACLVIAHMVDATQLCLSCHCTHGGCYATVLVLSLHTWWMLRNCACLVIAHMVVFVQNERAAEVAWSTGQIGPKSKQCYKIEKNTSFFRRRLLIRTNSIVYSFLKTRTHGKNGTKSTYEPTNHTWNSTPSQHFVHLQQNAMLISLRVAITAVTLFMAFCFCLLEGESWQYVHMFPCCVSAAPPLIYDAVIYICSLQEANLLLEGGLWFQHLSAPATGTSGAFSNACSFQKTKSFKKFIPNCLACMDSWCLKNFKDLWKSRNKNQSNLRCSVHENLWAKDNHPASQLPACASDAMSFSIVEVSGGLTDTRRFRPIYMAKCANGESLGSESQRLLLFKGKHHKRVKRAIFSEYELKQIFWRTLKSG